MREKWKKGPGTLRDLPSCKERRTGGGEGFSGRRRITEDTVV